MLTPFQRLLYCSRSGHTQGRNLDVLLIASGPSIRVFDAIDGAFISKWSHLEPETKDENEKHDEFQEGHVDDNASGEPSTKRRKVENEAKNEESDISVEVVVEEGSGKKRKRKRQAFQIPSIVNLTAAADGKHVVAITGEDKSVRVLELLDDGSLKQISRRVMPKRPSAIALSPCQTTILCADKFGDVYGLPLLWTADSHLSKNNFSSALQFSPAPSAQKPLGPAASTSTVHSRKNLRALEMQQRDFARRASSSTADNKSSKPSPALSFEHQLLLGHVSLLTDIISLSLTYPTSSLVDSDSISKSGPSPFEGTRSYILTSDRDEHIRVSRGIPQAHIIENYCLGHGQFISRLHVPAWKPEVLISGGGDDAIFVWDWLSGEIMEEVDVKGEVEDCRKALSGAGIDEMENVQKTSAKDGEADVDRQEKGKDRKEQEEKGIAVSGIWSIQTGNGTGEVLVACEAVPALIVYKLGVDGNMSYRTSLPAEGNVLDVSIQADTKSFVYSMDCIHVPWSTNIAAPTTEEQNGLKKYVGCYRFDGVEEEWVKEACRLEDNVIAFANREADPLTLAMDAAAVGDLLYGIEHLRKKAMAEEDEEDG